MTRTVNRDAASAEFFDGTARGEFLLRHNPVTGVFYSPQSLPGLEGLDSELEWTPAAGTGTVVSYSIVHAKNPDGGDPIRSIAAIIELDEGPWWWGAIVDADPDAVASGDRVTIAFEAVEGHETVPVFRRS